MLLGQGTWMENSTHLVMKAFILLCELYVEGFVS